MLTKCKELDQHYFLNHPVLKNHISLLGKIKETFSPDDSIFFLKAPGRVNLIGEHTDYNMGPVLPCAINKEIVFCIRPGNLFQIHAINTDEKFSHIKFSINQKIEPESRGSWGNYIKAGIKGVIDFIEDSKPQMIKEFRGYDIIVSGNLPQAAGVSSSSALVVAAALSFALANKLDLGKQMIAGICAKAEHFVGTSGGGMDQAASLLGKKNAFLYMEFNPLKIKEISAPEGFQLILFNSLIMAEKSGKARLEYNRRVLECKIAVDLFKHFFNEKTDNYQHINFIGEIKPEQLGLTQIELDKQVEFFLSDLADSYSVGQLAAQMAITKKEFNNRYRSILQDDNLQKEFQHGFKIKSRFKHVYYECRRVNKAVDCLLNNRLDELGDLINQSHESLSRDYEVSIAGVDELVKILRENGAMGARIMGAGFGGMVLALTETAKVNQLIEIAKKEYYLNKASQFQNDFIFPCVAADGAGLL
jgi:N-acetylgalactosamine kinase